MIERTSEFNPGILEFLRTHDVPARTGDVGQITVVAPPWYEGSVSQVEVVVEELREASGNPDLIIEVAPGAEPGEVVFTLSLSQGEQQAPE